MSLAEIFTYDTDSLVSLGKVWGFTIQGDATDQNGNHYWDLEFTDVVKAASFASTMNYKSDEWPKSVATPIHVDIRQNDSVTSLYSSVVLTFTALTNPPF